MLTYGTDRILDLIGPGEQTMIDDSFEFFRILLSRKKRAYIGIGQGNNIVEAMEQALSCPLLKDSAPYEAESLIVSIAPTAQTTLGEVQTVCDLMEKSYGEDVEFLWGLVEADDQPVVVLYVLTI